MHHQPHQPHFFSSFSDQKKLLVSVGFLFSSRKQADLYVRYPASNYSPLPSIKKANDSDIIISDVCTTFGPHILDEASYCVVDKHMLAVTAFQALKKNSKMK